jgi:hypothetical protein
MSDGIVMISVFRLYRAEKIVMVHVCEFITSSTGTLIIGNNMILYEFLHACAFDRS